MRVQVHPCDNGACGWHRLRWPAEVLAAEGHDVQVTNELNAYHDTVTGRMLTPVVDADVVVLQRPLVQAVVEAIPRLQSQGVAVVVEVDDDFHALPKGHGARRGTSVENDPTYNRMWLRKACERADLVTVTTPALAERYGAHGRVAVLPNLVPASYLSVPTHAPRVEAPTVGWTGSVVTHVGDLDVMGGVLPGVLAETGARFVSWGVGLTEQALGVKGRVRPWADLRGAYPRQVADLDVGLVPLADNAFNAAKSWLKGMEYAALGVPFIASPRAEYRALWQVLPDPVLADPPETWRSCMRLLLTKPEVRSEIAGLNREAMTSHTYENHADRWADAWRHAADNRTREKAASAARAAGRMVA